MERLNRGDICRHFKGNLYQIITFAKHSETEEKMVVYQKLYGDFETYVRPYSMFMSEVDHDKYPDIKQKYRFEKIEPDREETKEEFLNLSEKETINNEAFVISDKKEMNNINTKKDINKKSINDENIQENKGKNSDNLEREINPVLLEFLDAESFKKKIEILSKNEGVMDDKLIDDIAVVLDAVVPEGQLWDRYKALKNIMLTQLKYEHVERFR
ncbi:Protein of unknown function [Acetitomaculum ruminis DSM 5522]|uniref:DUF1653 domain-containing protein n=1 Tax=Acetitomaculum ruminis DSM 5522 TaxID=1120918 RepID=A0A1I0XC10_9FIRM|nr:DUF1653 domain-containing protein [Acetitomaculum ruminis]SFA98565.1 Protein of unknown function [Acetitomaculum ruminis DSM 5522]